MLRPFHVVACAFCILAAAFAHAQAGPPFRTDDPETPGNRHWEINIGNIADHNPTNAYYQVPDFDINYGAGNRVQLKLEFPIALHTDANSSTTGAFGEFFPGVKWRFYEHRRADASPGDDKAVNFSVSTYPQLILNNASGAAAKGIFPPGPDFLLPLEANARFGWLRVDGEAGYWFGNSKVPQQWIRGLLAGHEFSDKLELYAELYDIQDANRIAGAPKQREATLGGGGRAALNHDNSLLLMFMAGRSFQAVTPTSGQPSWIAYLGVQILLGPKDKDAQVEEKTPAGKKN